jgi:hypothetical protein
MKADRQPRQVVEAHSKRIDIDMRTDDLYGARLTTASSAILHWNSKA